MFIQTLYAYIDIGILVFRNPCNNIDDTYIQYQYYMHFSFISYHKKSLQNAQNVGCRKNLAKNLCPLTICTFWCFIAPRLLVIAWPLAISTRCCTKIWIGLILEISYIHWMVINIFLYLFVTYIIQW